MCLAYPGKIISINAEKAVVDFGGVQKDANVSLVPDAEIGDYVIVHTGFAIQKLSQEDAAEVIKEYEKADGKYGKTK